jgi:beta-N-acetylhexosaminidase
VPRLPVVLLAVVALGAAVGGVVVGADRDGDGQRTAAVARAPSPLPLAREVAQLFLLGYPDDAELLERLKRFDVGGYVVDRSNWTGPDALRALTASARTTALHSGHLPPLVLTSQPGGDLNSLTGLPPATTPASLASAPAAAREAADAARALRGIGVSGVLGPAIDVGSATESPLGELAYSDDPVEVSAYATRVVGTLRNLPLVGVAEHFPGLGASDRPTELGPASVGLGLGQLRRRDLVPFRAAIAAGVPAVLLSSALYPMNDFTAPASLSPEVATDLLRLELRFAGVAIADDLAAPAVSSSWPVPRAAVLALRAGADMLYVSGPPEQQTAAYEAVLRAVRSGSLPRRRVDEAVRRILELKRNYGLLG